MHTEMWEHAAVQENLATLRRRGVHFVEPGSAPGWRRPWRWPVAEPDDISCRHRGAPARALRPHRHELVVLPAAPASIDPVRVVTNRSSGKQGYAVAAEARGAWAEVILVTTTDRQLPVGVDVVTCRQPRWRKPCSAGPHPPTSS